jgi:hypothetical protein
LRRERGERFRRRGRMASERGQQGKRKQPIQFDSAIAATILSMAVRSAGRDGL